LKPGRIFEALTTPTVFPALGHDVSEVYRTHSKDLLAQKVSSPPQLWCRFSALQRLQLWLPEHIGRHIQGQRNQAMDFGI